MGVHHAWGRTYKDAYQRFHAMLGHEERYQNGFDCQGLWVEVEVEKELGLRSKRDIEDLVPGDSFASIDRFVQLCKQRVDKYARIQTEQSIRLGYWMNWDRTDEDWAKPPDQRKSYFTMSEENNYTIWTFLKKCHARGLVYRGYDAMPWCPRCAVGLSEMETKEGYQTVVHKAVFVKFPLRGRPGENLLVWTTTPWTLTSNVAAAVNPDLDYLRVRLRGEVYYLSRAAFAAARSTEEDEEEPEAGKPGKSAWPAGVPRLKTIEQLFKEKGREGYEVLGHLKGADLLGWAYDGPFDEFAAQDHPGGYPEELAAVARRQGWTPEVSARDAHRVVAWKDVGATEGTGIVHIAPGCGKEDFELGKEQGLPPVAPLAENGLYLPGFGDLTGRSAGERATAEWVLADLQRKGLLFATEPYPHRYPHCWRCKTELLYRLVDEWFINMSWRDEIKEVVRQAERWLPEEINGEARELDWLSNMGDWMISKKRFWGLALPIWVDEQTGDFEVIGSRAELKERAVEGWERFEGHSPHRPWIDLVKIRNPKTGNRMSRIPDVGNPWLDAGIVPFSTVGYNHDRAYWEKWFPAHFVTESFPGQFRNWFYALLAMSTMMVDRAPFQVLLGHGQVRDQWGEEMHKSLGNAIPFNGAADGERLPDGKVGYVIRHRLEPGKQPKPPAGALRSEVVTKEVNGEKVRELVVECPPMSADVIRWLYCRHNPAVNVNFGPDPADELRNKFFLKLWNSYLLFCNCAVGDRFDPNAAQVPVRQRPDMDRWILSELQKLVGEARRAFTDFDVMDFCLEAERFVDDRLSNWYVRRSKPRFWSKNAELDEAGLQDKQAAYQTLYAVLTTLAKLCAPVIPFLSEVMYQNLVVRGAGKGPKSVHLCAYPEADKGLLDEELSRDMDVLLRVVSLGLAARNNAKIKVRQPLAELKVQPAGERERRAVERFPEQILSELNVKRVTLHDPAEGPLLNEEVCPNLRTLKPKFKAGLDEVLEAIRVANPVELAERVKQGEPFALMCPGGPATLEPGDLTVQLRAPDGWVGAADRGTQVAIDTRVSEALKLEGLAREVVRRVQELRKQAGLEMSDHIALYLASPSEQLGRAIEAHRGHIANETQARQWSAAPLDGAGNSTRVKVEGQELTIELRKVTEAE
jgi:isoleucyl-tRNA synthetase